jgi:hypothetical protein
MLNLLIALFLIAHGIVHPILAYHPSRDEAAIVGGLWKNSWLLGAGPTTKSLIWAGSVVASVLFVCAGLSLMGWIFPQDWWRTLLVAAAVTSLLVLVVFWFAEFFFGIVIDAALLGLVLLANWNPAAVV